MEARKNCKSGVPIWMTTYIVEYKKAFGAGSMPDEKEFFDKDEAEWFVRAMKRSNYITRLIKKSP